MAHYRSKPCRHCGSPAIRNPCWWVSQGGGDPPCYIFEDDADQRDRDALAQRAKRKRHGIIAVLLIVVCLAIALGMRQAFS